VNENPYASPVDTRRGEWDHSLWWSFVRAVAKICIVVLFVDAIAITRYVKIANPERPLVQIVSGFFADWKSGAMPTWPDKQAATKGQLP
jgi:hypothetical protein